MTTSRRRPYVGAGADGALRSAQIDREEADVLEPDDPRREALLESARRWEGEADWIESEAQVRDGYPGGHSY